MEKITQCEIEKVKNLTDQEYEKILREENKENDREKELEIFLLEKAGLSLEELDNIDIDNPDQVEWLRSKVQHLSAEEIELLYKNLI